MTQAAALYQHPIGQIIRTKRKSLHWSIRTLVDRYVQLRYKHHPVRAEEAAFEGADFEHDPLMLTETDVARYERGEPVRMPISKLRLLCIALKFSQEEIARILARVHRTLFADKQDETSNVISLATATIGENAQIKDFIRQHIGSLMIEDIDTDEALRIVSAAITTYLDSSALLASSTPTSVDDAMSLKPSAPPEMASSATLSRKETPSRRAANTARSKKRKKRG